MGDQWTDTARRVTKLHSQNPSNQAKLERMKLKGPRASHCMDILRLVDVANIGYS